MNPSARIQAICEILQSVETELRPADALVSAYFRARRYIGSKDRADLSKKVYGVLRHRARLDWWLEKNGAVPTPRLRMLAFLTLSEDKAQSEVEALFTGSSHAPEALDADEKKLLRALQNHTLDHPSMPDLVRAECPAWAAPGLQKRFGKKFLEEMQALLTPAPLDLRVNPLKATREKAMAGLQAEGLKVELCLYAPYGLRVHERPSLAEIKELKDGTVEIQDEGSQLVAALLDAQPGERVVDFCAGAGGKTLAIAAGMKNKGHIVACDVLAKRLARSTERFRKAGFHNIEIKPITTEHDPWVKHHKQSYDRVLVDAPCSGTGTWRRNPDQRWRSLGPGLDALLPLQASILDSAARLVKPGGRLVYATCSLLPEEDEDQAKAFLARNPAFDLVPLAKLEPRLEGLPKTGEMMILSPATHKTDGFFAAVFKRKPKAEKEEPAQEEPAVP